MCVCVAAHLVACIVVGRPTRLSDSDPRESAATSRALFIYRCLLRKLGAALPPICFFVFLALFLVFYWALPFAGLAGPTMCAPARYPLCVCVYDDTIRVICWRVRVLCRAVVLGLFGRRAPPAHTPSLSLHSRPSSTPPHPPTHPSDQATAAHLSASAALPLPRALRFLLL